MSLVKNHGDKQQLKERQGGQDKFYLWEKGAMVLAFFLVALIYSPTLTGPFVFDDLRLIPLNPQIRLTEINITTLQEVASSSWPRPVAMLSFALNYYFHQYEVAGYHLVNILVHLLTGFFLYLFLQETLRLPLLRQKYGDLRWLPLLSAVLWLVHPLQTQSISYIIQRMNSLAALFYLLALLLYVKGRKSAGWPKRLGSFIGCGAAWVLALGCKQNAAILPFFIFLYEWFFLQDLSWQWVKRYLFVFAGGGALLAGLLFLRPQLLPYGIGPKGYGLYDFTMGQRLLTEMRVVFTYLGLLFLPHPGRLNLDYDYRLSTSLLEPITTLWAMAGLGALVVAAIVLAKRERLISFALIWFVGNLVIESSFIALDIIFEHRMYLPSMFLVFMLLFIGARIPRFEWGKRGLVIVVLVLCSFWTYERNLIWADSMKLFQDNALKSPAKPRAAYNLACEYAKRGEVGPALIWLERVVTTPDFKRWDLIKYDRDLNGVRNSIAFQEFYGRYVPQ